MIRYDGFDEDALRRATGAARAVVRGSVPSVMDLAHQVGAGGAPSGTLVVADEQTAGRGRHRRLWHSPAGAGVWMAMLLRPAHPPRAGALGVRVGLAVVEAVAEAAPGVEPMLRWPNDVMVGERKLAGVLCEARWSGEQLQWVAVGVGINVAGPLPPGVRDRAIALAEVAPAVGRVPLLERLVPRLVALAELPAELSPAERAAFGRVNWLARRENPAAEGVDRDGALLMRGPGGELARCTDSA